MITVRFFAVEWSNSIVIEHVNALTKLLSRNTFVNSPVRVGEREHKQGMHPVGICYVQVLQFLMQYQLTIWSAQV